MLYWYTEAITGAFQVPLMVKNLPTNTGEKRDAGSVPGWGRFFGGGYGNLFQHPSLENPNGQRILVG